ncbi:MAG: GGDEF domain-containing protein [Planctomycetota bacterium]
MAKGLSTKHARSPHLGPKLLGWCIQMLHGGRRRRLQREVHRLRRQIAQLREDNRALADRNDTVEQLSAELMRFNLDLSQASRLDPMTGLLNRAAFEALLGQEHALAATAVAQGRSRPYSVIMIDVDHFKAFNDALGHPAGDQCLIRVAQAVQQAVRKSDAVGRYGGEELIVLCPGLDTPDATHLAERLRLAVRELAIEHPARPLAPAEDKPSARPVVTVSLGLATGGKPANAAQPDPPTQASAVVVAADRLLYRAKHAGRDRVIAA